MSKGLNGTVRAKAAVWCARKHTLDFSSSASTLTPVLSTFLSGSTRFLLTRGSPSALSTACRLDAVGGPKYAASSFGFFLACGRDLEPEGTAPETEPLADMVTDGNAMVVVNVAGVHNVSFVYHSHEIMLIRDQGQEALLYSSSAQYRDRL